MMLRKATGPRGFPTEVTHSENSVMLRVPLGAGDELVGWLNLEYRRDDPLLLSIAVRAPSRAIVLERTMLRSDLRNAQTIGIRYSNMIVEPAAIRGLTTFQFEERLVIITAMLPSDVIARFLHTTDDVVAPGQPETDAVSSMLQDLLQDSGA
jgi:hypothetical protein